MTEIARLNNRWRVVHDPLQWILQVRRGRKTTKATGWKGRRFCQWRRTLIRDIGELCGPVDPDALAIIQALPDRYGRASQRSGRFAIIPAWAVEVS